MAYVPKPLHHESYDYGDIPKSGLYGPTSITIYAMFANKRPVGFAPWPAEESEEPNPSKKKKRKRGRR